MQRFDDLIVTLEVVRDAVWAKDASEGFEAVTVFLLEYLHVFGHSPEFMARTFPTLERLKLHIQSKEFDEANVIVLALLAKLRSVSRFI